MIDGRIVNLDKIQLIKSEHHLKIKKQQKNCSIILIYFFVPHALPMHLLIQAELSEQHYTDFLIKKWRWMTIQKFKRLF